MFVFSQQLMMHASTDVNMAYSNVHVNINNPVFLLLGERERDTLFIKKVDIILYVGKVCYLQDSLLLFYTGE